MRKMKDSGIEWIGEIPEEWEIVKTLYVLIMPITDGPHTTPELFDEGIPFVSAEAVSCGNGQIDFNHIRGYISKEFYDECCKKYIPKINDIYMIKSGATTGKVALVNTNRVFTIWSPLAVFRCDEQKMNYKYLYYTLQADYYLKQIETKWSFGTQQNIGMRVLEQLRICFPSMPEQQKISAFLDRKCSEIDSVTAKTKATIEEYKKLKQAIITQAVTKGIRKGRKMKDSGVEWIGEIPEEWKLRPFRHILKKKKKKNYPIKSTETPSLSIELGVTLYSEKTTILDRFKDDFEEYKLAHIGDLVMNSMNMIVGATGVSDYYGCVSPIYYTFYDENENHITAKFCEYIFRSKAMLRVLYSMGKGIYAIVRGDDRVNTCRLKVAKEDLKSLLLPIPSLDEQQEIIDYIYKKCAAIDTLIAKKEQLLTELENYKKSVIYEYVTGKKEIG